MKGGRRGKSILLSQRRRKCRASTNEQEWALGASDQKSIHTNKQAAGGSIPESSRRER